MSPEKLTFDKLKVGNNKGDISVGSDSIKHAKKSRKSKAQKLLKSPKLSKSWKSAKSKKKLSKSWNSLNFNAKENEPSFLTPKAKMAFNYLKLAFIKALILWYFDLKYYIQIETDVSGYVMSGMLSQLTLETSFDLG